MQIKLSKFKGKYFANIKDGEDLDQIELDIFTYKGIKRLTNQEKEQLEEDIEQQLTLAQLKDRIMNGV